MSARQTAGTATDPATTARTIPSSSAVLNVVVRVAGDIPVRIDLTHAGTREQQLGMSLGTVLIYLRSAATARAVAEGWRTTAMLARPLSPILTGRRPLQPGPSTAGVLVRLAGVPQVHAAYQPAQRSGTIPALLRITVGPITWEIPDANAYTSLARAWRRATALLEDNPEGRE